MHIMSGGGPDTHRIGLYDAYQGTDFLKFIFCCVVSYANPRNKRDFEQLVDDMIDKDLDMIISIFKY
ncbi:hypothetical protein HanIR_Chr02g0063481 [Helianthus annuus]|nr:hypothetical protein HanIR_Chr02g0063481 [Helianthus annuus]